ncbi:D-beta-hydroxybutyrate dehydrogenase, mitochondrial [Wyeomyia smithii]|uniref:D-beta-hydroxybutyrate dehydrogenase, mitochondrial n=1 Tax=Wyeomyia smithii TaxID=174621 RepID=UPI002468075D|nr:D-beta-hydroxybutyrate dehydrogenase, mitochondrial [Wyeomyia smithii]
MSSLGVASKVSQTSLVVVAGVVSEAPVVNGFSPLTLATETLFLLGSGAFGMMSVLQHGSSFDWLKYVTLTTGGSLLLLLIANNISSAAKQRNASKGRRKANPREQSVMIVTGCDSGLGFNIAKLCHRLGFVVFAGCLSKDAEGAKLLQQLAHDDAADNERLFVEQLNITLEESVLMMNKSVKVFFEKNPTFDLFALVNNAGVMCFGEFEWQLSEHLEQQINVNLLGTMRMTKSFLPLVRKHRSRIINVTSHCSLQALPGLSVYSATKAALRFWTESLRMEMSSYGVQVINFIPGSLVMQSNICAKQNQYAAQMKAGFSAEQLEFYGSYFDEYNAYLRVIAGPKPVQALPDNHDVLRCFADALLDECPKRVYKSEPWRYRVYHLLFGITPTPIRDWLVRRFINMPMYRSMETFHGYGIGASL